MIVVLCWIKKLKMLQRKNLGALFCVIFVSLSVAASYDREASMDESTVIEHMSAFEQKCAHVLKDRESCNCRKLVCLQKARCVYEGFGMRLECRMESELPYTKFSLSEQDLVGKCGCQFSYLEGK